MKEIPVPECKDCAQGVILSADGSNHIYGENVGDVRPCRLAARSPELDQVRVFARVMANAINLAFVIYEVKVKGGPVEYAARRSDFTLPHPLLRDNWQEIERVAPSTLADAPTGEASNVSRETSQAEPDPFDPPLSTESRPECGAPKCLLTAHAVIVRCPRCGEPLCFPHSQTEPEDHECQGEDKKLSLDLEYAEETTPPAHALKIEWLDGGGNNVSFLAATIAKATCSCGEWEAIKDLDTVTTEALNRQFIEGEFQRHLGAAHGIGSGEEVKSKKEQIISLYESGVTDIAQIVRKVAARPSYVAQVLQSSGLITGYFDLYTTTARENNVYARFFRNVLSFKTVAAAEESVKRIGRLYDYFERLGDRAGQHQAMILALTGKNRARWSGKIEESEVFSEWLTRH